MRLPALAALLVLLTGLAACAGGGGERPAATGVVPERSETSWPPPPSESEPPAAVAALPRAPEPLPTAPPEDPRRLVGLSGETLRGWMGESVFVRRDGIAEIWRFASETCFLDIFLYREGGDLRVAHLDARSRVVGQRTTLQACYGRIMASRPKPVS
jgi:hypothetical protein